MAEKDMKRMNRRELVEIIFEQKKREEELLSEIADLKQRLEDKTIRMEKAGSIAEAAIEISGVLQAAQRAADVYLHSLKVYAEEHKE